MEWLVIIAILIVIAVGMLWLRMVRQGPDTVSSRDPHRLDDSFTPPVSPGMRPDIPPPTTAAGVAAEEGPEVIQEPDPEVPREPEATRPEEPERRDDPPRPEA